MKAVFTANPRGRHEPRPETQRALVLESLRRHGPNATYAEVLAGVDRRAYKFRKKGIDFAFSVRCVLNDLARQGLAQRDRPH